jgi:uncharacterized protein (UPF0261 family)
MATCLSPPGIEPEREGALKKKVYVVGTCDTKEAELRFVKSLIVAAGAPALLVDVGTRRPTAAVDISAEEVAAAHPGGKDAVLGRDDRGAAVAAMGEALAAFLAGRRDIAGVIGLGGSGNTGLVTRGMRALPMGVPKLMVSTIASGNVAPYVGPTDITMMYAVTDVAGINSLSRVVLANAAHAIAGMAMRAPPAAATGEKPAIGLTMFGVTTPCVDRVRARLEAAYDCIVFHATGVGGQSMEKLVDGGFLRGILDITTTEVADYLLGGVLPCTEDRFGAVSRAKIPCVLSVGALDMVNFGAPETVPERYRGRKFLAHNPHVTLMRTTAEENRRIGTWIADRFNLCEGPIRLLIPEIGVSGVDAPSRPFYDPEADRALFDALGARLRTTSSRRLIRLPHHINDPEFADALVEHFLEIAR